MRRDQDTIECDGVAFVVTYDYEGGESAYVSDYDGGHPGCDATIDIERVALTAAPTIDLYDVLDDRVIAYLKDQLHRIHEGLTC